MDTQRQRGSFRFERSYWSPDGLGLERSESRRDEMQAREFRWRIRDAGSRKPKTGATLTPYNLPPYNSP